MTRFQRSTPIIDWESPQVRDRAVQLPRGRADAGTVVRSWSSGCAIAFPAVDRWESAEAWQTFLRAWSEDYAALDEMCGGLTVTEVEIGAFRIPAP